MLLSDFFPRGVPIDMVPAVPDSEVSWQAVIVDVQHGAIVVQAPPGDTAITLRIGGEWQMHFRGPDGERYEMRVKIVGQRLQPERFVYFRLLDDPRNVLRRSFPRVDVRLPCQVIVLRGSDAQPSETLEGMLVDLSRGGALLRITRPLPVAGSILVQFHLHDGDWAESFHVLSEVLESRRAPGAPHEFATRVRFLDLTHGQFTRITRFILRRRSNQAISLNRRSSDATES